MYINYGVACQKPASYINKHGSRLNASLVLKLDLKSQEGNRSPGLHSSICVYFYIVLQIICKHNIILFTHTHTHTPIARVIIPPKTVILAEGSLANPAKIFLNLSASSYGLSVSIYIESMLPDTPTSVEFVEGKLQAVSENMCMCIY